MLRINRFTVFLVAISLAFTTMFPYWHWLEHIRLSPDLLSFCQIKESGGKPLSISREMDEEDCPVCALLNFYGKHKDCLRIKLNGFAFFPVGKFNSLFSPFKKIGFFFNVKSRAPPVL